MNAESKEFHELAQDSKNLSVLINELHSQWLEDLEEKDDESVIAKQRFPLLLRNLARANLEWMDYYCESPIEKTMIASLICIHARHSPLSLIIAPNFLHREDPLEAFESVCEDMRGLVADVKGDSGNITAFIEHIKACRDNDQISEEAYHYCKDHYLFYNLFDLSSAFHLSLQPVLKQIQVNGQSVRPDMLFWSPANPKFRLVVECDGFDYHSDKKAFTKDRQRDRAMFSKGLEVLRFSGSEIYNDPVATGYELADFLRKHRYN
jgi:hypothetical protein